MASSGGGLSETQVEQLRKDVAAGKRPRVRLSGSPGGGPTGGTVRSVGDPVRDGADFLTVRVTINGVTDELHFAPEELSRGGRSAPKEPAPAPRVPIARSSPQRRADTQPSAARTSAARTSAARTLPPKPAPTAQTASTPVAASRTSGSATSKPKQGRRRASAGAPVSIVLTSVGAAWTVSARRGARSVVKGATVDPGVVSSIAALLDMAALEEAVAGVNDTARAEAQARADHLRAELAQVQAVLDSHRRP